MPRDLLRLDYLPLVSIALMLLASAAAYAFLPDTITVHWNFAFEPDGFARKSVAILTLPLIGLGIIVMQLIGRFVGSNGDLRVEFSKAVIFAMPILLVAHLVMIAAGIMSVSQR